MQRPPARSTLAATLVFACAAPGASFAAGQTTQPALHEAATQIDCAMLRSQPNAPLSVEACEAMKESQKRLAEAASAPGGERRGDDTMTCSDLEAEMRSMHVPGVSAKTAAEAQAAGAELRAVQDSRMKETATVAARQGAETAAASLAPNAVQGAVAGKHAAEQSALARNATQEMQAATDRATLANSASALELAASLQANPRFARVMQLMVERNCETNDGPPPR